MTSKGITIVTGSLNSNDIQKSVATRVSRIVLSQKKKRMDAQEPRIIDQHLLLSGIEDTSIHEMGIQSHTGLVPDMLPLARAIKLSFCNIVELSNLEGLNRLRSLKLDNNFIEKIDGLGHLTSLEWLDLSFNSISRMEGLENLLNLKDLSLFNNSIQEVTGLSNCKNLNVLSLGRNKIKDLKQIECMRSYFNLKCLCLEGNPVCELDVYLSHVYAYLPQLKYLDYLLIDGKQVASLAETYHADEISELKEKEGQANAKEKIRLEKAVQLQVLKNSFVDSTATISEDLFASEIEPFPVTALQPFENMKEDVKEKVEELLKSFRQAMAEQNKGRISLVSDFESAVHGAEKENDMAVKSILAEMQNASENAMEYEDRLIAAEVSFQERVVEGLDLLESQVKDTTKVMSDKASEFIKSLEEILKTFSVQLHDIATTELESFATGNHPLSAARAAALAAASGSSHGPDGTPSAYTEDEGTVTHDNPLSEPGVPGSLTESDEKNGGREGSIAPSADVMAGGTATLHAIDMKKISALANKDEMMTGVGILTEAQATLIQSKDDLMQAQISTWSKKYFEDNRERLHSRYKAKLLEIARISSVQQH